MLKVKTMVYWLGLELWLLGGSVVIALLLNLFHSLPLTVGFLFLAILLNVITALSFLKNPEVADADLYQFEDKEGGD